MQRILLVEDDPARYEFFVKNTPKDVRLVWARSGGAALTLLKKDEADTYDALLLDHDLDRQAVNPVEARTNGEVVTRAIVQKVFSGTPVLVHSANESGAAKMVALLEGAGFPVERIAYRYLTESRYRDWLEKAVL